MAKKKGSRKKIFKGELEVDHDRGVIYFHLANAKDVKTLGTTTLLRICRLPKIPFPLGEALDITHMIGCSWTAVTIVNVVQKGAAIPLGPSPLERKPEVTEDPLTAAIKRKVRLR